MPTQQPGFAVGTSGGDVHVIRAPRVLDIAAVARLLRLIDAQLAHAPSPTRHIVLDFSATRIASPAALAALRHAAYATRIQRVGLDLIGADGLGTLPLSARAPLLHLPHRGRRPARPHPTLAATPTTAAGSTATLSNELIGPRGWGGACDRGEVAGACVDRQRVEQGAIDDGGKRPPGSRYRPRAWTAAATSAR